MLEEKKLRLLRPNKRENSEIKHFPCQFMSVRHRIFFLEYQLLWHLLKVELCLL